MIVMKFGGTSVEDAASIERVAEIIKAREKLRPAIVVSAMGKTTSRLLQAAEASASGDNRTNLAIVADLKTRHTSEARRLVKNGANEVFPLVEEYFEELKKLLEGLAILGEVPPRGLDKILSYGELLSSAIVAGALAERGIRARLLDSRELIKTDDRYGQASPIMELTNRNIRDVITPVVESDEVPVIQGFIGSTREGATTTLGFEGSDYTATLVGAAMDADDIQIWKDVSGLMTADPAVFAGARTVKRCTFTEAAELTYFGAKVLHPKAIHPAARKNIPVHIYNSKRPSATGTAISADRAPCANLIKSIAYKRPVTVIRATATNDLSPDVFLKALLDRLARRRAQPLITAAAASSAAVVIDSHALKEGEERDLIEELSSLGLASGEGNKAIVTLVGEELRNAPSVGSRIFNAIDEIGPALVLHGSSPIAINFIVGYDDVEDVIARLHKVFFGQLDSQVFE
ncbi:MAG TPA: aspartate kinase [Blastocatellia bacterium]|nr:aspartate kinase [Blastocatellia bacterium]